MLRPLAGSAGAGWSADGAGSGRASCSAGAGGSLSSRTLATGLGPLTKAIIAGDRSKLRLTRKPSTVKVSSSGREGSAGTTSKSITVAADLSTASCGPTARETWSQPASSLNITSSSTSGRSLVTCSWPL